MKFITINVSQAAVVNDGASSVLIDELLFTVNLLSVSNERWRLYTKHYLICEMFK